MYIYKGFFYRPNPQLYNLVNMKINIIRFHINRSIPLLSSKNKNLTTHDSSPLHC